MTTLHNTLEQGKRLKELGVLYENSIWCHLYPIKEKMISTNFGVYHYLQAIDIIGDNEGDEFDHTAAPALTLGELFEVIDWSSCSLKEPYKNGTIWRVAVVSGMDVSHITNTNPTHLAADILIFQLEHGVVTEEEVNEKLKKLK